jgi:hypothetical protein
VATHAGTNTNPQGGGGSDSGGSDSYSGGGSSGGADDPNFHVDPDAIRILSDVFGTLMPQVLKWILYVGELARTAPLTEAGVGDTTWTQFAEGGYFKNVADIEALALAVVKGIEALHDGLGTTSAAYEKTERELEDAAGKLKAGFDAQGGQIPGSTHLPSSGNETPNIPDDEGYGSGEESGDGTGRHKGR